MFVLQWSVDLTTVNIAKNADLVKSLLLTTLLLLWSKITVNIAENADLANILVLTKKFVKSALHCTTKVMEILLILFFVQFEFSRQNSKSDVLQFWNNLNFCTEND